MIFCFGLIMLEPSVNRYLFVENVLAGHIDGLGFFQRNS